MEKRYIDIFGGIDYVTTAINIKKARLALNYSVNYVADQFNIDKHLIYDWEKGKTLPRLDNLCMLAGFYGLKLDDLLVFHEPRVFYFSVIFQEEL